MGVVPNETSLFSGPVVSPWRRKGRRYTRLRAGADPSGGLGGGGPRPNLCLGADRQPTPAARSASRPALRGAISSASRPTYGRCSRWGIVAPSRRRPRPGRPHWGARCAICRHPVWGRLAGHDPKDTTSVDLPVPGTTRRRVGKSIKGMKIGNSRRNTGCPEWRRRSKKALWRARRGVAQGRRAPRWSRSRCRTTKYALPAYYNRGRPAEASLPNLRAARYGRGCA